MRFNLARMVSITFIASLTAVAGSPAGLDSGSSHGSLSGSVPHSIMAQQTATTSPPIEINGHHIGEPIKTFLRLEREARDEVEVCRENSGRTACAHLLDAVEKGQRAEISTTAPADLDHPEGDRDTTDFVIDGGKLVKISMLLNAAPDALKNLGHPSSEKSIPAQNKAGAKWENHLIEWDSPTLYVSLYLDNNPSLHDHRLTLVLETPAEHARDNPDAEPAKPPAPAASK